jgi:hypothetical protein
VAAAAFLLLLLPRPTPAQETGTPVFSAPVRSFSSHELGLSLSSPEGADLGLEGFAGVGSGRGDWGFRLGFLDRGTGTDVVLGVRYRLRLFAHSPDFPLDGALSLGVGASFDDGTSALRTPLGLSFGRRLPLGTSGVSLMPYLHPVLVPTFRDDDSEMAVALGLGLDLRVARQLDVRVSGGAGDLEGFAVGIVWVR